MQDAKRNIHNKFSVVGQVVSEEKSSEKLLMATDNNDRHQMIALAHMAFDQVS